MFELIENGDEKILVFELKINDIAIDQIKNAYKTHFEGKLDQFYFEVLFQKNQNLEELLASMKTHYQLPFFFQIME